MMCYFGLSEEKYLSPNCSGVEKENTLNVLK